MPTRRFSCSRFSLVLVWVCVSVLALPAHALATKTLGLSAGIFKFNVAAGSRATGSVIVMNSGDEPLKVMVYASDQKVDDKGGITYIAPTRADLAAPSSPAMWSRIAMPANSKALGNIPYLELEPGERIPVRFTVEVPSNVPPGDHNLLLFFESFVLPTKGESSLAQVSGRIGARVTMRVEGTVVERLEVRPFNVPSFVIGGEVPYQFLVRNVGNVDQRVGAHVMLLDRNDNEIQRQTAINGLTVFAGTNREATGTLIAQKIPFGPFKVRIDVAQVDDSGNAVNSGAGTITKERDVWLVPLWLLILLGVFAAIVVTAVIWSVSARATRRLDARRAEKASNADSVAEPVEFDAPDATFYDPDSPE